MEIYKLNLDGGYAVKIVDGVSTGEWHNTQTSEAYLAWIEAGNTPEPADEVTG
jgi:hypothetical protein